MHPIANNALLIRLYTIIAGSLVISAAAITEASSQNAARARGEVLFETKVRPILAARCYSCHAATAKATGGGLRLDQRTSVIGKSVISGDPEHSALIRALEYQDPSLKMPPTGRLQQAEIDSIKAWVRAGAAWPDTHNVASAIIAAPARFWAFQPLKPISLPSNVNGKPVSPIDQFLLAGRTARHMGSAQRADKRTLIRRATFDLTGLPPTPEQLRAFLADSRTDAYSRMLDTLLASPAYGEKWGRHWLDVARYADSNGVDENLVYASAFRYRDYVIRAFNQDKPISRFFQEQIAGDLLPRDANPDANLDQIIATGYLSLGPKMLAEDDPVKQEEDIIDEQVDTLGKTFLGLTLGCARCHDHKFDPLPQTDYYAIAGIFKSTKTMLNFKNMAEWQEVPLGSQADQARLKEIQARINARKASMDAAKQKEIDEVLKAASSREPAYRAAALELIKAPAPAALPTARLSGNTNTIPTGSALVEAEDYVSGNVIKDTTGFGKGIGVLVNRGEYPDFAEYAYTVPANGKPAAQIDIRYASGDKRPCRLYINGILVSSDVASGITGGFYPDSQKWECAGVYNLKPGLNRIRIERESYFPHIDKFLITPTSAEGVRRTIEIAAAEANIDPTLLQQAIDRLKASPNASAVKFESPDNADDLLSASGRKAADQARSEIADLEKSKPPMPRAMAVSEGKPTDLKVHLRGNYLTLAQNAPRGFPAVLVTPRTRRPAPDKSGRLELAEWLTSTENPLTARVFVNRVWRWHFGTGIVASPDNFGKLGERPSNQQLLDWMAADFMAHNWSLKRLHKTIMLSDAYCMASRAKPLVASRGMAVDPENRTLWKFPRRRLEAEEIRDSILFVSGDLDTTIGGSLLKFRDREYVTSTANADPVNYTSNRRSCYLPIIRSALYDVYTAFDFGDPTVMNGDRATTTVAPQALFMMNSPIVLTESRALASNLLKQTALDDTQRVQQAYLRCLARSATSAELKRAIAYVVAFEATESSSDAHATKATTTADERKSAAWQSLCKALMSCNEFVYID